MAAEPVAEPDREQAGELSLSLSFITRFSSLQTQQAACAELDQGNWPRGVTSALASACETCSDAPTGPVGVLRQ
jgi:hypothetical protein